MLELKNDVALLNNMHIAYEQMGCGMSHKKHFVHSVLGSFRRKSALLMKNIVERFDKGTCVMGMIYKRQFRLHNNDDCCKFLQRLIVSGRTNISKNFLAENIKN